MGQITKVTPDMIQVANNVTSKTVGNTTSGISLTFDSNGVITSAANVTLSVANTQLTGTITATQLAANSVNSTIIAANTISNTNIQTGAIENYMRAQGSTSVFAGMRNRIINGAMTIDQRNAGANLIMSTTTSMYSLDRWQGYFTLANKFSIQQDSSANTVAGFASSLKVVSTTATTPGASDEYSVNQIIEGLNTADFSFGTASAKTITLSFWVRSSLTGTFGGALRNSSGTRSYPFSYSISSANTWEQKILTIPGDTSGTWQTNTNPGILLGFSMGNGSNNQGTAGAWTGSNKMSVTGETQIVGTQGATWYITGVQLEAGSVPTPFEYRQYGTELALCQRYYETSTNFGTYAEYDGQQIVVGVGTTVFGNAVSFAQGKPFSVRKRATPTVVLYYQDGSAGFVYRIDNAAKIAAVALYLNPAGFLYTYSAASALNQGYGYYYSFTANAEL